jgi:hypothetical protein
MWAYIRQICDRRRSTTSNPPVFIPEQPRTNQNPTTAQPPRQQPPRQQPTITQPPRQQQPRQQPPRQQPPRQPPPRQLPVVSNDQYQQTNDDQGVVSTGIVILPNVIPENGPNVTLNSAFIWELIYNKCRNPLIPNELGKITVFLDTMYGLQKQRIIPYTLHNMVNHFEHDVGVSCSHYSCRNDTGRPCQHISREDRPHYVNLTVSIHIVTTPSRPRSENEHTHHTHQLMDVAGVIFIMTIQHGGRPQSVYQMTHYLEAKEDSGYHYQPEYSLVCTTERWSTDYTGRHHLVKTTNPVPVRHPRLADLVPN